MIQQSVGTWVDDSAVGWHVGRLGVASKLIMLAKLMLEREGCCEGNCRHGILVLALCCWMVRRQKG